jgi:hypothetical protein
MRMKTLLPALCFAAAILPLSAQETEAGIQGGLIFPQSDLRSAVNGRTGFTLGVHGGIDLQGGNELRPRIDYTRIDGGSFSLSSLNSTTTVQAVGVGIDYLRYLEGRRRGQFILVDGVQPGLGPVPLLRGHGQRYQGRRILSFLSVAQGPGDCR